MKYVVNTKLEYTNHLIEIARCSNFESCVGTACEKIVGFQQETIRQIPEPWSGDILKSKILFVSSNPSLDSTEKYPTSEWDNERIFDFFHNRFSKGRS